MSVPVVLTADTQVQGRRPPHYPAPRHHKDGEGEVPLPHTFNVPQWVVGVEVYDTPFSLGTCTHPATLILSGQETVTRIE